MSDTDVLRAQLAASEAGDRFREAKAEFYPAKARHELDELTDEEFAVIETRYREAKDAVSQARSNFRKVRAASNYEAAAADMREALESGTIDQAEHDDQIRRIREALGISDGEDAIATPGAVAGTAASHSPIAGGAHGRGQA